MAVTAGELSPIVTGLVYCSVIDGCQEAYELRRAQRVDRGADALVRAAARHGRLHRHAACVHRAEIMQLHGAWPDALEEARARARALRRGANPGGGRRGALPAGRGPSPARRARRGRGGLPGGEPVRARAAAGPGAAAAGAGQRRRRGRRDPPACSARPASRSSARGCCPPTSRSCSPSASSTRRAQRLPRARAASPTRYESGAARRDRRRTPRGAVELADGDAARRARRAAPRAAGVAGARGARTRPRARGCSSALACRALGRRGRAPRSSSRPRATRSRELGAAPDLARVDSLAAARRPRGTHGLTRARAAGAAPGRGRRDATRRSPPSSCSASGPSTGT